MKDLARLKSLQHLNLGSTKVTDAGLWRLGVLDRLQSLTLPAKARGPGLAKLREDLPGCKIE
jgi:hypothetical protein